jgi:hypothetical protein
VCVCVLLEFEPRALWFVLVLWFWQVFFKEPVSFICVKFIKLFITFP